MIDAWVVDVSLDTELRDEQAGIVDAGQDFANQGMTPMIWLRKLRAQVAADIGLT